MKRRHPCDACGQPRQSWQRLCEVCFASLPRDIRTSLIAAWKQHRKAEWREHRRRARAFLAQQRPTGPDTSPQATFTRTERLLGERSDPFPTANQGETHG